MRVQLLVGLLVLSCGCSDAVDVPAADRAQQGGVSTIDDRTSRAFAQPAPLLDPDSEELHLAGDVAFEAQFVTAPADRNAGLGPTFNNNSCNACHLRNGRGVPAIAAGGLRSQLLVRVSLPNGEPAVPGGAVEVPGFGDQLQDHAVEGAEPEASIALDWSFESGEYADGSAYELRRPELTITLPDGTALDSAVLTSLRMPPPVIGLGLLENVPDDAIVAMEDPDDSDGDGISGRANRVWHQGRGEVAIGRFGLKANQPDLRMQTVSAYRADMGITSPDRRDGDLTPEVDEDTVRSAVFYAQSLGVPAQRDPAGVAAGAKLFESSGCASCHAPTLRTGPSEHAWLSEQTIHPYTDLLLHDMGEGLADGRPDFLADGSEWRTSPLWGIGLTQTVAPGAGYLHDGRARTLDEAILWHGGEAAAARDAFVEMSAADRAALLAFLGSL